MLIIPPLQLIMGPKPLYFIGSTPAKDVAPPVGGWTDFVKGSKNITEIVELLLAEYEDAVTGAGDPPKPHHFFNNHNLSRLTTSGITDSEISSTNSHAHFRKVFSSHRASLANTSSFA